MLLLAVASVVTLNCAIGAMGRHQDSSAIDHIGAKNTLVEVAALKCSAHCHVSVKCQIHGFWKKITKFVPKPTITPFNNRTILNQVFEILINCL